jgi:hypothetical protein
MTKDPLIASVIAQRLHLLAELDTSADVSFMNRSRMRLSVFGVVDRLDRGTITTSTASVLFGQIEDEVASLHTV